MNRGVTSYCTGMVNTMTEWRDVPGYEGCYQVSDDGQVKSLARVVRRGACSNYPVRERLLKPIRHPAGYLQVNLRRLPHMIHRLVMQAFIGPAPEGMEVCHGNGAKDDNRLSNLRYGTKADNANDSVRHGTHHYKRRDRCKNGHLYTPENTAMRAAHPGKRPSRVCRTCEREYGRRNYALKKGAV